METFQRRPVQARGESHLPKCCKAGMPPVLLLAASFMKAYMCKVLCLDSTGGTTVVSSNKKPELWSCMGTSEVEKKKLKRYITL